MEEKSVENKNVAKRKATFDDLLKKKIKKEENLNKTKDIYVTAMDAYLTFKMPKDDFATEIINEVGDGKDVDKLVKAFEKLIYQCCDILQNPDLHKELGVVDPFDIVNALFDVGEKLSIGDELMDMIDVEGKVEVIKN